MSSSCLVSPPQCDTKKVAGDVPDSSAFAIAHAALLCEVQLFCLRLVEAVRLGQVLDYSRELGCWFNRTTLYQLKPTRAALTFSGRAMARRTFSRPSMRIHSSRNIVHPHTSRPSR